MRYWPAREDGRGEEAGRCGGDERPPASSGASRIGMASMAAS
jgi:hypothetical protein